MKRLAYLALGLGLTVLSIPPSAQARTAFDSYFSPGSSADYSLYAEPGQDGSPRVLAQKLQGNLETSKSKAHSLTLSGSASYTDLSQPVPIPRSPVIFPDSLGSLEGGVSYLRRLGERRQWGGLLSIGSASDQLFHSIYETEVQFTLSTMLPSRAYDAWILLLNYSNNRTFLNNIPLPGVAYLWNVPAHGLQLIAGFPVFMIKYQPAPVWSTRLSVVGWTQQSAEISRQVHGPLWAYAAYQRAPEQWMRAGRDDHSNRLIYDEKRTLLGLRSKLGKQWSLDLSGGWTFDRRMFESRDATHTGAPRANLSNGWIAGFLITLKK